MLAIAAATMFAGCEPEKMRLQTTMVIPETKTVVAIQKLLHKQIFLSVVQVTILLVQ